LLFIMNREIERYRYDSVEFYDQRKILRK
jgi:hypothetical protein